MAAKNKPYEQFGPYVLFKKLESDALSELWRCGRIDGRALAPEPVALRRFTGGDHDALLSCVRVAREIVPQLTGTSFARNQVCDVIDGVPFLAYEYSGGRTLRHVLDRARGVAGSTPNPVPLDQAMSIAEKVALSLATTADMKHQGKRLAHGALVPQFIWITDDGETRVAGQLFGPAIVASMRDPAVAADLGRYFAPERDAKTTEVFALGAVLYLLVTGTEPPEATIANTFTQTVRSAKTMTGGPIPNDIRAMLDRSLTLDTAQRYASIGEMKQALSALVHGGAYSATTFNLAFYVNSLLKKEIESEAAERDREWKVTLAPFLEAADSTPVPATVPPLAAVATASAAAAPAGVARRSNMPLAAAAAAAIVIAAGAGYYFTRSKAANAVAVVPARPAAPVAPRAQLISQPLVAASAPAAAGSSAPVDEAARKKAFEEAVEQKLQAEMMKLQQQYTTSLKQQQSKQAPVVSATMITPSIPSRAAEDSAPSAAQLDQQRLASHQESVSPPSPALIPTATAQPQTVVPQQAAPAPAVTASAVHEGDVVDIGEVDTAPHVVRGAAPIYPPMAMQQRAQATILITALISESGDVIEAKILRGDKRFGFEDAALRAVRATHFSPAIKDGKRVKTWFPLPVSFKL